MATQINSYNGGSVLPGNTVTTDILKKLIVQHTKPNESNPTVEEYFPLIEKILNFKNLIFTKDGVTVGAYDPLNDSDTSLEIGNSGGIVAFDPYGSHTMSHANYEKTTTYLGQKAVVVLAGQSGGSSVYWFPVSYSSGGIRAITVNNLGQTLIAEIQPTPDGSGYHHITVTNAGGGGIEFKTFKNGDIEVTDTHKVRFKPKNNTAYVYDDDDGWANFATLDGGNPPEFYIELPSQTGNFIFIQLGGPADYSSDFDVNGRNNYEVSVHFYYDDNGTKKWLNFSAQAMMLVKNGSIRIQTCHSYLFSVIDGTVDVSVLNNKVFATQYDLDRELAALKSRICYTIPLGSVGKVENLDLDSTAPDIACHATLFNPYMNISLDANANVVVNFGPSPTTPSRLLFAIYEYDREANPPVFKWVANTDEITSTVRGIQHFQLTSKKDGLDTILYSEHLYIFCVFGNVNTLPLMGNELENYINMNSISLALATGKQNVSGYVSADQLKNTVPELDLSTFSEARAQPRNGNSPARVFAAITNLSNLP